MKHEGQHKNRRSNRQSLGRFSLRISMLFMALFACSLLSAQTERITVKGIVTDNTGEALIGASVTQKGTTNGTMTGMDGDYSLSVPGNATLVITYVGFTTQEVQVGGKTSLNIKLNEDSRALDEVVVTALGIKRDRKSLGYALQEIKGDQLTEAREANIANGLTGRVAGLQVKQAGTGPAGSSRIVLRGNNSIGGNNQPLVVVDGVPIDSSTGGSDDYWGNRAVDRGSGMADISPDDIESMSVLKGPAAAALYGSRAGNGVIMITTKTGAGKKGLGVSINSNLTFDSPMQLPEYQNVYGQGAGNQYIVNSTGSWGEKMTGQKFVDHVGHNIVYSPEDNNLRDFLRTGTTFTNSVDLTSATDKSTLRVGLMHLSNKGVVPNSNFGRTSFTVRGTAKLSDKLSMDTKITYVNQRTDNRIKLGGDPDNIFNNYLMMPRSVHYSDLSRYPDYAYPVGTKSTATGADLSGQPVAWTDQYGGLIRNPYWAAYRNTNNDRKDRFLGFGSLKYEFTDWLNIQGRYGMDYNASQYEMRQATKTPYWETSGEYIMNKDTGYEVNTDFLITLNKSLSDKVGLVATAGGNIMYARTDNLWTQANGLYVPNFFNISNGLDKDVRTDVSRKQINSLYGTASFAFDNMLYLDLTARNDWSSTLNSNNRSYFYPSVGGSWIFTESLNRWDVKSSVLNYGKVRLSWAQVGNDTSPYQLFNYRTLHTKRDVSDGQITTILTPNKSDTKALYDLKNETIESYELGLELKAFNNRLGLDFAYYNKEAKDQILKMNTPSSTGFSYRYVNAGNVRNRGIELLLTGTPVLTKDFTWDVTINFSKNKNKILELADGIERQILSDASYSGMIQIVAEAGGSYGDIFGKSYTRNDQGEILIGADGLPTFDSDYKKLGNGNPDWMGGINNAFHYKGIELSFLIDMRYGGEVFMGSMRSGSMAGTLASTADGRESMVVPGVNASGAANTVTTTAEKYWRALGSGSEPWIYDATNVRLREIIVGYSLPRKLLSNTFIQGAKFSFVGRNIWMIHSKTKGFDPEGGFSTGNAQGFEYGSMPTLRSLGFNVNITF